MQVEPVGLYTALKYICGSSQDQAVANCCDMYHRKLWFANIIKMG